MGAASRWWLHHSLAALSKKLHGSGVRLLFACGKTSDIVATAIAASGADCVLWNRRYEPAKAAEDAALKSKIRDAGLMAQSFDGALLHEPSLLKTGTGSYYRVYTPFWKALNSGVGPRDPIDAPRSINGWEGKFDGPSLDDLDLLPKTIDWAKGLADRWTPGEAGAQQRLQAFENEDLADYAGRREMPSIPGSSRLSPHLAFGEVTPVQVFAALRRSNKAGVSKFREEIGWREFCYHLLFHNPRLHEQSFRPEFEGFSWRLDNHATKAWRMGMTGYPIVDAGMRELWQTGWMHNRVRMITASFLIKDLMIDWREGERWFWDTLVDADAANNPANWQWVAGSGADAAPFFRIFNPVLQGEKFDPDGDYVRRYIPEIAGLPDRYIHRPWQASATLLKHAKIELGKTYPNPIVDHGAARERALLLYQSVKGKAKISSNKETAS
jgi:deoxyribodipyrimidine photo-lyase